MLTKTLRQLVAEYGANEVLRIDAGNGCAGTMWLDWDTDLDDQLGDTPMSLASPHEVDNCDSIAILLSIEGGVRRDEPIYTSEWIEDDERNAPYQASNPYRYRLLF